MQRVAPESNIQSIPIEHHFHLFITHGTNNQTQTTTSSTLTSIYVTCHLSTSCEDGASSFGKTIGSPNTVIKLARRGSKGHHLSIQLHQTWNEHQCQPSEVIPHTSVEQLLVCTSGDAKPSAYRERGTQRVQGTRNTAL